jgi:hypothetical protein
VEGEIGSERYARNFYRTMRNCLLVMVCFGFMTCILAKAEEVPMRVLRNESGVYEYVRIQGEQQDAWELRSGDSNEVIFRHVLDKRDVGGSVFEYSNLVDVVRKGDEVGVLLSVHVGLMYIRCARTRDGQWEESWRKLIVGATGLGVSAVSVKLEQISRIDVITKDEALNTYDVSRDAVLKDGKPFVPLRPAVR